MKRLRVTDFGPIKEADVKFGDLTVLVGPQASGKSLFVQLYKLIEDAPAIAAELERYGFDWREESNPVAAFSSLYFGGGLEGIFGKTTEVRRDGRRVDPSGLALDKPGDSNEHVFLIPAQRVLVLQDGWPKPFMAYGSSDPYAIRQFSESIRRFMKELNKLDIGNFIDLHEARPVVEAAIYGGSLLRFKREGHRRQVVLKASKDSSGLPYNVWSAGQREFTPLLLGLDKSKWIPNDLGLVTVIVEEPEMGLHPQAIIAMGLLVFEVLASGRRIILSTHSPVILDLVWAIRELSQVDAAVAVNALGKIFGIKVLSAQGQRWFKRILKKSYHTYFFHRTDSGVVTQDISSLDPGDENEYVAGWGGLSGFSGRIAQIVGEATSR